MTRNKKLQEAIDFANENGYNLAVYTREDDHFALRSDSVDSFDELEDMDIEITVSSCGTYEDFNFFYNSDGTMAFILHNIPDNLNPTLPLF